MGIEQELCQIQKKHPKRALIIDSHCINTQQEQNNNPVLVAVYRILARQRFAPLRAYEVFLLNLTQVANSHKPARKMTVRLDASMHQGFNEIA